jgi:hypothetical protein
MITSDDVATGSLGEKIGGGGATAAVTARIIYFCFWVDGLHIVISSTSLPSGAITDNAIPGNHSGEDVFFLDDVHNVLQIRSISTDYPGSMENYHHL